MNHVEHNQDCTFLFCDQPPPCQMDASITGFARLVEVNLADPDSPGEVASRRFGLCPPGLFWFGIAEVDAKHVGRLLRFKLQPGPNDLLSIMFADGRAGPVAIVTVIAEPGAAQVPQQPYDRATVHFVGLDRLEKPKLVGEV